jgi:hypothetical protein
MRLGTIEPRDSGPFGQQQHSTLGQATDVNIEHLYKKRVRILVSILFISKYCTMAQGSSLKLNKKRKSLGAMKKKGLRTKTVTKGRKEYQIKHINGAVVENISTTKAINRKNEMQVAAKAISVGTQFFMSDIKTKGQQEYRQQLQQRDKKQMKSSSVQQSQRVQEQIRKLGRNISK